MTSSLSAANFDFASVLRSGDHVSWPQGTGEPTGLTARLFAQAPDLPRVSIVPGMVTSPIFSGEGMAAFDFLCLNGAANTRRAAALSQGRILCSHLSTYPDLIRSRRIPLDVVFVRVRPTDDAKILSLGVVVDFVHEMIAAARVVIAEIDERMPLTCGDTLVARADIDHFVLADGPEVLIPDAVPSAADLAVAARVAELIPDRATVQFGVGGLPVAVTRALSGHKDLGVHSGVVPDAVVDLIESGVVTNRFKGEDEGISVTGGLFGTRKLFDFAHANPEICMRRVQYTHAGATMARLRMLHTVNSAIAIDLSGQVNAEVANGRYLGAIGGQVDFVRGGRLSEGGRSIIALTSTTPDGRNSKIVARLAGQPVTTARSDVDLIVTEFGVADLWGRDMAERARALVAIAHPDFRDQLMQDLLEA